MARLVESSLGFNNNNNNLTGLVRAGAMMSEQNQCSRFRFILFDNNNKKKLSLDRPAIAHKHNARLNKQQQQRRLVVGVVIIVEPHLARFNYDYDYYYYLVNAARRRNGDLLQRCRD